MRAGPSGSPEPGASKASRRDGREDDSLPPPSSRPEAPQRPSSLHLLGTIAVAAATAGAGERRPRIHARSWTSTLSVAALWSRPAPDGDPGLPRARPPASADWSASPRCGLRLEPHGGGIHSGFLASVGKQPLHSSGCSSESAALALALSQLPPCFFFFFLKTPNSTQRAEHVQSAKS